MPSQTEPSAEAPNATPNTAVEIPPRLPALIPRKRKPPPQSQLPIPQTPRLPDPPNVSQLHCAKPRRRILSSGDHERFLQSSTYDLVLSFVFSLSESASDSKISSVQIKTQPPQIHAILSILSSISSLVDSNPPKDQGNSRFGNPAFRDFIDALAIHIAEYHRSVGLTNQEAIAEVSTYLSHAFGSRERIDYGSGHELNFLLWLLCLNRLSLLPPTTFAALVLCIFPSYIKLLRKIQSTYYLEPAGSHGVWGLDDYHFLPFLFGASQLLHHPYIRPLSIHNELILEEEGGEYMYLDMIRWTMETKTVKDLKWTQPMLDDISGAKSWEKVEQGMRRMFVKEVLGKLPIMQHFLFGSLIPAPEGMSNEDEVEALGGESGDQEHSHGPGHVHRNDTWGDCCGIPIPSTVAAAQESKKKGLTEGLRRVPFD